LIRKLYTILRFRWKWVVAFLTGFFLWFVLIPTPRFNDPTSTVVFSEEGELLGARIADDGQWRFPVAEKIPDNYRKALLMFEDRRFYFHPGVNPVALVRALFLNLKHKKFVSGGSTLSMQVARLSRKNPPRNLLGKLLEINMALKLEMLHSKREILYRYASAAPFGGNVVGIDAASWRYFNRPPERLSWAEAAMLAVLPNSPSLLYPGKNVILLKNKRDKLLKKLYKNGEFDQMTLELSVAEPLPFKPNPLPTVATHVVDQMAKEKNGERVNTTIQFGLQQKVNNVVERHHQLLMQYGIHNISAIIVDVETGNIRAYIGNTEDAGNKHGGQVDVVSSPRSTGSIMKPFLYASMLHYGELLPNSLVPDIPVNFSGFSPKNFDYSFSGAVPASKALGRSLNIPAVEMLHQFGEARFLDVLRGCGFSTFKKPAEHYGLSLILGGGETSLFELAGAYASLARVLDHFNKHGGYSRSDIFLPSFIRHDEKNVLYNSQPVLSASSIWFTMNALQEVNRPLERSGWQNFSSTEKIAWKTGTSFGFRDAWAVATTPDYVVAVWAGNSDGEGRPGLTGVSAAAPVLFDIIDLMPRCGWFEQPEKEITSIDVCAESGMRASPFCPHIVQCDMPLSGLKTQACKYHQLIHLSSDRLWQVNASCYHVGDIVNDSCFILPPRMEWYYRKIHPEYRVLPPIMKGCASSDNYTMIELLYPRNLSRIFVPTELNGEPGKVIFEAAHRNMDTRIFWHLDDQFVAETDRFHQIALSPSPGEHTITLIDAHGNTLKKRFSVVSGFGN
jgi:penicillin-binding protein 1C